MIKKLKKLSKNKRFLILAFVIIFAYPLFVGAQIGYRYARIAVGAGSVNVIAKYDSNGQLSDSRVSSTDTQLSFIPVGSSVTFNVNTVPVASSGGKIVELTTLLTAMNGSDTVYDIQIESTNANHTGTGNTLNGIGVFAGGITGDANSNLNGIIIGALTGTTGAASEVEAAINIGAGWDAGVYCPSGCTIDGDITIGTNDVDDIVLNGPTTRNVIREDFGDSGIMGGWVTASNSWGASAITDTSLNYLFIQGSQMPFIFYRWEQAVAAFPADLMANGYLLFELDDTAGDGVDIGFNAQRANNGGDNGQYWDEDLNRTFYCEASVKVADISELTDFYFGWSIAEAVIDAGAYQGGNTYAYLALTDSAGDLDALTELNGTGTNNDDTGVTWADAAEHVLRVTIGADSVSFSVDGVAVTQVNAVLNFDDGDKAACVAGWINSAGDGTPDPDISFNYVEIGVSQ